MAIAQAKLAFGLLGDVNVLWQGAEIVARPAEEAAALRRELEDAVGEKFRAARGVGFEQLKDEVVPRTIRIEAEAQRLSAGDEGCEWFRVKLIDPQLRGRRRCGRGIGSAGRFPSGGVSRGLG